MCTRLLTKAYFGVGRVTEFRYGIMIMMMIMIMTEFRYGIKVGESVRNKNYAALGGVYDQVSGK